MQKLRNSCGGVLPGPGALTAQSLHLVGARCAAGTRRVLLFVRCGLFADYLIAWVFSIVAFDVVATLWPAQQTIDTQTLDE